MQRLLDLIYLMLPVYAANMAPPFSRFLPGWNRPISRRWLGEHKTVIGFLLGVVTAMAVTYMQHQLAWERSLIFYDDWFALGAALGAGAMIGDCTKSFFKRLLRIAPGQSWIPADQLDFIIGGLVVLAFWIRLSWFDIVLILVISFVGDILVNHAAFWLRIRETKW
jgi:CDP-2,3-bis-(O-geranylgeranyl)-sn-glycerol synthase